MAILYPQGESYIQKSSVNFRNPYPNYFNFGYRRLFFARPGRAAIALSDHHPSHDPERRGSILRWLPVVQQWVVEAHLRHPSVKYHCKIDPELLAAALCLFTRNALMPHARSQWSFTCGQVAQKEWYEALFKKGIVRSNARNNSKRNALMKILQLSGLIVIRDSTFRFGGSKNGIAQQFGLGANHPNFREFKSLYGHVVDPKTAQLSTAVLQNGTDIISEAEERQQKKEPAMVLVDGVQYGTD